MSELTSPAFVWPSRQEMRAVAAAWEAFMAGEARGAEQVRPIIWASWQRCQRLRVDPHLQKIPVVLSAEEVEREQEQADLVSAATPVFETIVRALAQECFLLGLSGRYGHILHLTGHPVLLQRAMEVNAVPGGGGTEEQIGTAITNVVLAAGHAEYVLWSEHYCQTFHPWASLGAPLHHPVTQETIGIVMIGGNEPTHFYQVELLERLARHLEQLLHHEELVRRLALLEAYHRCVLQYPQDTVLALDGRGHVCGASSAAAQLLADAPQQLLGTSFLRLPALQVTGLRPVSPQEEVEPYQLSVSARERGLCFRATAIPVRGARQPVGTIVILPHPRAPRSSREPAAAAWRVTYTFADLVGTAPAFRECLTLAYQAAQHDFPVLLVGESGTGKELLAQAIHSASPRRQGPFVAVNCGVANDELLAAELFGYVAGAFTDAAKGGRKGKIELAHGGTLFLDEVDAMPPKMQVSLLRVLEEGKVTRVGAERPVAVDMRVIAASNEDLKAATGQKRFRVDLYHRLCAFPIVLPALRDRTDDLVVLSRHLLAQLGFPGLRLSTDALALLKRYHWPGNVRELRNVLLRSAQQAQGILITRHELPQDVLAAVTLPSPPPAGSLRASEQELILRVLAATNGNIPQAAARLGIHQATLYRKLNRSGLSPKTGDLARALGRWER